MRFGEDLAAPFKSQDLSLLQNVTLPKSSFTLDACLLVHGKESCPSAADQAALLGPLQKR